MSTVEEIKEAITKLPPRDRTEMTAWFLSLSPTSDIEMSFNEEVFERLARLPKSAPDIACPEDDDL